MNDARAPGPLPASVSLTMAPTPRQHWRIRSSHLSRRLTARAVLVLTWHVLCLQGQVADAQPPTLQFNAEGTFKAVIFTDLHYGENAWDAWGPRQDVKSTRVMDTVLGIEKPDLVIYLGDQVTANNLLSSNASLYWRMATASCRQRGVPWAAVLGNHDAQPFEWEASWFGPEGIPTPYTVPKDVHFGGGRIESGPHRQLLDMQTTSKYGQLGADERSSPLSLSRSGPLSLWPAVGNYHLPVLSANGSAPAVVLYFLDSGGGDTPEVLSHAQGRWLNETMHAVNGEGRPEYLFVHIPLPAMASVGPARGAPIEAPCMGNISDDDVTPVTNDWGLIDILANRTSFQGTFSGHDHGNDWCCPYESKLWLCFARHSGYGGYGHWTRGAKVLRFREEPFALDTWIRFEDGSMNHLGELTRLR